jgi:hypothetical protein
MFLVHVNLKIYKNPKLSVTYNLKLYEVKPHQKYNMYSIIVLVYFSL